MSLIEGAMLTSLWITAEQARTEKTGIGRKDEVMGPFQVPIAVGDPQGGRYESLEALVGTGATYATLPASILRSLGVSPHDRGQFVLADGSLVERGIGQTWSGWTVGMKSFR